LLKRQKSTFNISRKSDFVQALPLPKGGADQNVPQPKPGAGDHNVPERQKAALEVEKWLTEAILFTMPPGPIMSDEKFPMVEEAW
jgi:hypothetical protein